MRRILSLALLLAFLAPSPAAPAPQQLSFATEYPASSMPGEGARRFADAVALRSGAALRVDPSFDGSLGLKGAELSRAIESGAIAAGDVFAGTLGEIEPVFLLSSLPFLATGVDEAARLYAVARPYYEAVLAHHRQRLLYAVPWPPSGLWAKQPILEPEGLKGLAIRSYDQTSTMVLQRAGADARVLSFADAVKELEGGSLDGVLSSGDGGAGRLLWQWLPTFVAIDYSAPLSLASINRDAYDALPEAQRRAIDDAAHATERELWQLIRTRLAANYATMRAHGVDIVEHPSPALAQLLSRASADAIADWARQAGPTGDAILKAYRARPPA